MRCLRFNQPENRYAPRKPVKTVSSIPHTSTANPPAGMRSTLSFIASLAPSFFLWDNVVGKGRGEKILYDDPARAPRNPGAILHSLLTTYEKRKGKEKKIVNK